MIVKSCELLHARVPLVKPYVLSFATVTCIDSIVVRILLDNGGVGIAEAVPLPGYSNETIGSILYDCKKVLPTLHGVGKDEFLYILANKLPDSPFVKSAIYSAWELASEEILLSGKIQLPLLSPISSSRNPRDVLDLALKKYNHGYRTLKLKVGRDFEADLITCPFLLDHLPEDVKLRIDANQAYTLEQARSLLQVLDHQRSDLVELLEQPFGVEECDWHLFEDLAKETDHIPLMLDESILQDSDVDRAAEVGADLVKLKLFKHQGVQDLIALAKRAKRNGLGVVLGNGVSSEIGNILEAHAFQKSNLFQGAFEGNGFEKLTMPLIEAPAYSSSGYMAWFSPEKKSFSDLLLDRLFHSLL